MSNTTETTSAPAASNSSSTPKTTTPQNVGEHQAVLQQLIKDVDGFVTRDRELLKQLKQFHQSYNREIKGLTKKSSRKTIAKSGKESKRSIKEKMEVSAQANLLSFLGKPADAKVSISEARKSIGDYIRTHNLQDQTNKHKINPDTNLRGVLGEPRYVFEKGELGYSYLNLPRYISDLMTFPPELQAASATA